MRSQSATSGVNARGTPVDLQYDEKLKPSPLVPRTQLKKESAMNEAFIRGFLSELEKDAALGALAVRGAAALRGMGGAKGLAQKGLAHGKEMLKDPLTQVQIGQSVLGGLQNRRQASQQQISAQQGQLGASAKKPTGFIGALGGGQ